MKLLIAEDDAVSAAVIEAAVRKLGHESITAHDGAEAWALLERERIRVVISDWQMPNMNGLQLCRKVRAESPAYVFFILLTQMSASGGNKALAIEAGVDDFLDKPVDVEVLSMRLRMAERILDYERTVHELRSIVPICSYCKKIRDDANYWQQVEGYLAQHTGATLSHGVCPDCYNRVVVPQIEKFGIEPPPYQSP